MPANAALRRGRPLPVATTMPFFPRCALLRTTLAGAIALGLAAPAQAAPGQVWVYPYRQSAPAPEIEIAIGPRPAAAAGAQGAVGAALPAGTHRVVLSQGGAELAAFPVELSDDEQLQVAVTLMPGRAPVYTLSSNLHGRRTVDLAAVAVPAPQPPLAHGEDDADPTRKESETQLRGVEVESQLLPTNDRAAFVDVERSSAQVQDTLSAEDIARSGDSDAATALRRVTGLSLVGGRFVYVRGLGERYSSVLLNGAQIPSPDPTRRVVPLDLIPTDVLDGILVQKTYSSEMPGEFGGGTVQLQTRGVPEAFLLRAQGTLGFVDGSTVEDGLRSRGGGRDWLGRDDGFRAAPAGLFQRPFPRSDDAPARALGADLVTRGFAIDRREIGPDSGAAFSVGNVWKLGDEVRAGFIGAARYAQQWDTREEQRAEYAVLSDGSLVRQQDFDRELTERNIDGSVFLSAGLELGSQHRFDLSSMLFRQTQGEDSIDQGLRASGNVEQAFASEWIENELLTHQLRGQHRPTALGALELDWQYTTSRARRDMPYARSYVYSERDPGQFVYSTSFPAQVRYEALDDELDEAQLVLRHPFDWDVDRGVTLRAGGSVLERERDSEIFRYSFRHVLRPSAQPTPIEAILNPGAFERGEIELLATGRATDFYTAQQSLDAWFVGADLHWHAWRADLGLRREDNDQQVVTRDPFNSDATPIVARIAQSDTLPAGSLTWAYSDAAQLRLAYSRTVSRPDFRELSSAPYTDPLLDISVIGNPDLQQADIRSADLRWEYYFDALESFSVALFDKRFTRPIELVRTPASGDLLELRNADSATNRGVELDLFRSFGFLEDAGWVPAALRERLPWVDLYFGANYAWIDSEVDLGANAGIQTSAQRPLQGQSPYVANLSLAWIPGDGASEATLLYNVAGRRISKVGESGVPDEYEQPFSQLDFSYSRALPWDGWKLKLRLRNLLDPEAEFRQGSETSRLWRKGREASLTLEWTF